MNWLPSMKCHDLFSLKKKKKKKKIYIYIIKMSSAAFVIGALKVKKKHHPFKHYLYLKYLYFAEGVSYFSV